MQPQYSIFLVDDHTIVRNGLKELIEHIPGYKVTRQYDNGKQLTDDFPFSQTPDIILLDVAMPVMDGKATMEWLNSHGITCPVLILTFDTSDKSIIELFKLGVRGYIPKTCTADILERAIGDVVRYGFYHNELLSNALIADEARYKKDVRRKILEQITEREKNFLRLVCDEQEYTYEQIASLMFVHRRTVDGYREALFEKFNIKSKTGLVLFAIKYNLLAD